MADNFPMTPGSGRNAATDQVTYSGDTADVQLVRPVLTTGAEGSRTVIDLTGDATNGLDVDVTRIVDGAHVTFGAEADAASAGDTTTTTFMALFKRLLQRITTLLAVFPTTLDTNSGNKSASSLRVVLATDQPALTNALLTTASGNVAHDGVDSGNPLKVGGQAVSSEPAVVSTGDRANFLTDLVGKHIVLPYANPEQFEYGVTAAITDTTSTAALAAAGAGVRHYVTAITVTNSHATVGTFVKILDGSTIIWEGYAAAAGGGFCISFPTPLRGTANTAVNVQPVTTGANVIGCVAAYKGA